MKNGFYRINSADNVATALCDVPAGQAEVFGAAESVIAVASPIPLGHKVALQPIARGEPIIKYGYIIGAASGDIAEGACVDANNCESRIGVTDSGDLYRPGAKTRYTLTAQPRAGQSGAKPPLA